MRRLAFVSLSLTACALVAPVRADDLTGAQKFLCSAHSASACCDDGQCASGTAMEVNVPQFVEVDLVGKQVTTTKASGLNRMSPIESMKRADGQILIHGNDSGRAYSFVIVEHTGELSAAIAAAGCNVSVFGACTPMPAK
jgi:hypothetical protein